MNLLKYRLVKIGIVLSMTLFAIHYFLPSLIDFDQITTSRLALIAGVAVGLMIVSILLASKKFILKAVLVTMLIIIFFSSVNMKTTYDNLKGGWDDHKEAK